MLSNYSFDIDSRRNITNKKRAAKAALFRIIE